MAQLGGKQGKAEGPLWFSLSRPYHRLSGVSAVGVKRQENKSTLKVTGFVAFSEPDLARFSDVSLGRWNGAAIQELCECK